MKYNLSWYEINQKSYYEILNQIDKNELYDRLIEYGMFSERLIPLFSAKKFLKLCKTINKNGKLKEYNSSGWVSTNIMRNTGELRQIGIPVPMSYHNLCKYLSDEWFEIIQHFRKYTKDFSHKISLVHLRKNKESKSLFKMNYDNKEIDGIPDLDLRLNAKYIVKADISSFFSSIYTHALDWAYEGKETAKRNYQSRNKEDKETVGKKLDKKTRALTANETHGILIGPHTSNLLSEIILVVVDYNLWNKGWRFTRAIDDYKCYVNSYDDKEKFIIDLQNELAVYNLTINYKKVSIEKLPQTLDEDWIMDIHLLERIYLNKKMTFSDARCFWDRIISLVNKNDHNASIITYAFKILKIANMDFEARRYTGKVLQSFILKYTYLLQIIDINNLKKYHITNLELKIFIEDLYEQGRSQKNTEVMCYAIYYAVMNSVILDNHKNIIEITELDDAILLLLGWLYAMYTKNKNNIDKYEEIAFNYMEDERSFETKWIFVYEVLRKSRKYGKKFKDKSNKQWKQLIAGNVSFLKKEFLNKIK